MDVIRRARKRIQPSAIATQSAWILDGHSATSTVNILNLAIRRMPARLYLTDARSNDVVARLVPRSLVPEIKRLFAQKTASRPLAKIVRSDARRSNLDARRLLRRTILKQRLAMRRRNRTSCYLPARASIQPWDLCRTARGAHSPSTLCSFPRMAAPQ